MCESRKAVNSRKEMIGVMQAGDKYFVNAETWTAEKVEAFLKQYQLPEMLALQIKTLYLSVVTELSELPEVTEETVHNYCSTGLAMMCIDWGRYFDSPA